MSFYNNKKNFNTNQFLKKGNEVLAHYRLCYAPVDDNISLQGHSSIADASFGRGTGSYGGKQTRASESFSRDIKARRTLASLWRRNEITFTILRFSECGLLV